MLHPSLPKMPTSLQRPLFSVPKVAYVPWYNVKKKSNQNKVVEHSFRVRFCWCDSARAQGMQKQTCRQ